MKHLNIIILVLSFGFAASTQAQPQRMLPDTVSVGYGIVTATDTDSRSVTGVDSRAFEYPVSIDVTKNLYGKIAGLAADLPQTITPHYSCTAISRLYL